MKQFFLSNFEAYFDGVILERGREYAFDRWVTELQEVSPGEFSAVVEGSERYLVKVSLQTDSTNDADRSVIDISCTCPHEFGPYCKHEAALLFVLREQLSTVSEDATGGSRLTEVLAKLSRTELERFSNSWG